jgi:hypothetical protein
MTIFRWKACPGRLSPTEQVPLEDGDRIVSKAQCVLNRNKRLDNVQNSKKKKKYCEVLWMPHGTIATIIFTEI